MKTQFIPVDTSLHCQIPRHQYLEGQYCYLQPLNITEHWQALYDCLCKNALPELWQYLPAGPFKETNVFLDWLSDLPNHNMVFIIFDKDTDQINGLICYLNNSIQHRSIEIGWVIFSDKMQRTRIGTEVIYLLLQHAFSNNYRRLEWKCDSMNKKSFQAAQRFGFHHEGVFRSHQIVKGRNRDTAWFSITDKEWPSIKNKFEQWLQPSNFDSDGKQRIPLSNMMLSRT